MSKYENTFAKGCVANWSEEDSVIINVSDLKGEEIVGTF